MTEIDVGLLPTRVADSNDSLIGLDSSDQTVRVQIPELTVDDITNKTEKKGLVSGADLDGLGGGGTRLNPFLYSGVQYPVGSGMREHKLVAADLPTGTEPVFILAYSSSGEVSKVCIPKVADLPALAEVDTIRFFLEAGGGSVEFSNTETGVALGTTITGGSRLTEAGCLVARNLGMDVWGVSFEASQPSGPEVLKDWTAVSSLNTELSAGVDFGTDGYSGITLEVRKLNYSGHGAGSTLPDQNNLTLAMYLEGKVLPANIFTSYEANMSQGNTSAGSKKISQPNLSVTSFGMYSCQLRADFSQAFNQIGYSAKFSFVDSNSTIVGMADVWQVSSFSDPSGYTSELWLTGKTGETLTYEYRIIRK